MKFETLSISSLQLTHISVEDMSAVNYDHRDWFNRQKQLLELLTFYTRHGDILKIIFLEGQEKQNYRN